MMSVAVLDYAHLGWAAQERGDLGAALRLRLAGAKQGCAVCMHAIGYTFDAGEGVEIDKTEAMRWYRKAWRADKSTSSATNIAVLYRETGNHRAMAAWYRRAADTGVDGDAYLELAKCYLSGSGVRRSEQLALRCLTLVDATEYVTEESIEEAQKLLKGLKLKLI